MLIAEPGIAFAKAAITRSVGQRKPRTALLQSDVSPDPYRAHSVHFEVTTGAIPKPLLNLFLKETTACVHAPRKGSVHILSTQWWHSNAAIFRLFQLQPTTANISSLAELQSGPARNLGASGRDARHRPGAARTADRPGRSTSTCSAN